MKLSRNERSNWCAALAMSALLALPLCAQQKNGRAGDDATSAATTAEKSAPPSNAAGSGKAVAAKGVFALPATPRPAPFPGPAAAAADTRPPGQLLPRYEFAGMYDYINFAPGDPFANFNTHGGSRFLTFYTSSPPAPPPALRRFTPHRNPLPLPSGEPTPHAPFLTTPSCP